MNCEEMRAASWESFVSGVKDALATGEAGEAVLAEVVTSASKDRQTFVAAALGDGRGKAGTVALRTLLQDDRTPRDLRCVAIVSLVKRCGIEASDDLALAVRHRDDTVQDYAVRGLAVAGDDRAWDEVLGRMQRLLRRPRRAHFLEPPSDVGAAVCYLAWHSGPLGDRTLRLVSAIRESWTRLHTEEQEWLRAIWQECAPTGPEPELVRVPDGEYLADLARRGLY